MVPSETRTIKMLYDKLNALKQAKDIANGVKVKTCDNCDKALAATLMINFVFSF